MDLNDYQESALETAIYPKLGSNLIYPALGLAGEAGEFCNKLKKVQRDDANVLTPERREQLIGELGDIMWYVALCAFELQTDLNEVAERNIAELSARKQKGNLQGAGDSRGLEK